MVGHTRQRRPPPHESECLDLEYLCGVQPSKALNSVFAEYVAVVLAAVGDGKPGMERFVE